MKANRREQVPQRPLLLFQTFSTPVPSPDLHRPISAQPAALEGCSYRSDGADGDPHDISAMSSDAPARSW